MLRPRVEAGRLAPAPLASVLLCSLPSVVLLSVRCLVAVVALTVSVFSVHFSWVLMLRVLKLLILVCPCRLAFCVFFVSSASVM